MPPTAAYLQTVVRSVLDDPGSPIAARNECHRLMLAIERNDLALITETLTTLERLLGRSLQPTTKVCAACGASFPCHSEGGCWCTDVRVDGETLRALNERYQDCLCPECLRKHAERSTR